MERFGCCSKYIECSNAGECLHKTDAEYQGCSYRMHLDAGRIFYGYRAGQAVKVEVETSQKRSVFLHCLGRLFSIRSRHRCGYSMELSAEQADIIEAAFKAHFIPFKNEIDDMSECIIDKPSESDKAPANSRVYIKIGDQEFNVLNFNDWLIRQKTAELLAKAFDNNYIESRAEIAGKTVYYTPASNITTKEKAETPEKKAADIQMTTPTPESSPKMQQVTLLEYAAKSNPHSDDLPSALCGPGDEVIAEDEYWGTYIGVLESTYTTVNDLMARVRISECIVQPSQWAIIFKNNPCPREAYKKGELHNFPFRALKPYIRYKITSKSA